MNQAASINEPCPVPDELQRAIAQLEASAEFLGSRYMEKLIASTLTAAADEQEQSLAHSKSKDAND